MAKISGLLIGLVLVSGFMSIIAISMAEFSNKYNIAYDNSSLAVYNQLDDISTTTEELRNETQGIQERSGTQDILGSFFSDAYDGVKLTGKGYDFYDKLAQNAAEDANLGPSSDIIRRALSTIVLIIIIVGIFISALIKSKI